MAKLSSSITSAQQLTLKQPRRSGHYGLVKRGHKAVELATPNEPEGGVNGTCHTFRPPSHRIVLRQSRCPGCHAPVTLQYERVKSGDTYEFHLLSPSPAHPLCEAALEDLRL